MKTCRLHLLVGYDGRPFCGWQSQPDGNAVQDHLEKAFAKICGARVVVHGAGRTDAGVHALGQSAHVDVPAGQLPLERWRLAVNAWLPAAIRVKKVRAVKEIFHARYAAKSKHYRYRIYHADVLEPLEVGRSWHLYGALDLGKMRKAAALFTGRHDFQAFAANRGQKPASTVRELWKIELRKTGPVLTLGFEGEGFLYKMVRLLTGAMVQAGQGKVDMEEIARQMAPPFAKTLTHAAPAAGLFLVRVGY